MKRFQNILAILPENNPEEDVLAWAQAVSKAASAQKVTILRTLEPLLPDYPGTENDTMDPEEERRTLTEKFSKFFPDLDLKVQVKAAPLLTSVLHELSGGDYDLVIVPLTDAENRNFVLRLSRKSPAGVLAVPTNCKAPPSSILVGMDCSDLSILALKWAEAFASLSEGESTRLEAVNIFNVPQSSRATRGKAAGDLKAHIDKTATWHLQDTIEQNAKQPKRWIRSTAESNLAGSFLAAKANKSLSGLLVIGCQGKNAFTIALLGSDAADVVRTSERPLLIVKQKNQTLGFLRNLLGLSN